MRRIIPVVVIMAAIAGSYEFGRNHPRSRSDVKTARQPLYYVDPMHPAYRSDKPGIAPDCGMTLVPVFGDRGENAEASSPSAQLPAGAVSVDTATQGVLGIRLARAEKNGVTRTVRAVGRVLSEDTRVYRVNSGVDGLIQETYEDSVGMAVKKDQKLATYYAPDFLAVASGFLAAVERVPSAVGNDGSRTVPFPGAVSKQGVSSMQGYTDRLRNLGMSDEQIRRVADTRQLPEAVDIVSPADGFILARNISAGQHVERGMEFYTIADLSRVWVVADVDERDAPLLHPGGAARIALRSEGRRLPARIANSLPQSEVGGGTVKLRLEVDNPAFVLRPDMLVDVDLPVRLEPALTVPLDALVDSGTSSRVYVECGEGIFEPREVETGWRFGDRVEILRGIQVGERVVAAATFLIDSESRLKAPVSKAVSPATGPAAMSEHMATTTARDPSCGMTVDPAKAAAAGNTLVYRGATYYFCSRKCKLAFPNDSSARRQGE